MSPGQETAPLGTGSSHSKLLFWIYANAGGSACEQEDFLKHFADVEGFPLEPAEQFKRKPLSMSQSGDSQLGAISPPGRCLETSCVVTCHKWPKGQ